MKVKGESVRVRPAPEEDHAKNKGPQPGIFSCLVERAEQARRK